MTRPNVRAVTLLAVLVLVSVSVAAGAAKGPTQFLTGPNDGDAYDIAMAYITSHLGDLGLSAADLEDMVVRDRYTTRHNGVTHIYLQQRLDGVEVYGGVMSINIARDGSVINLGNSFVANLAQRMNARSPQLSDTVAIGRAAEHFGLEATGSLQPLSSAGGPDLRSTFRNTSLSRDDIPVRLVYEKASDGSVRLAWETILNLPTSPDWWVVRVDAASGEVIGQHNWTNYDSYQVFEYPPFDNPLDAGGSQQIVVDPADPTASPFGWHDTDGAAGPEFTDTQGNNVDAHDDLDGNNTGGFRPDGGPTLDFLVPWMPNQQPDFGNNLSVAIINLFYGNNVMHDLTFHYGFDQDSGNFQTNNYGVNPGGQGDHVEADALDNWQGNPPSSNNANFSTPPDGISGRMQMFGWLWPFDNLVTVNTAGPAMGDYDAASAAFGPAFDATGITGDLELVDDGGGPGTASDGCEPLVGFTPGNIALIDRGTCNFDDKVFNAETAGAPAAIMVNDRPGILNMGGDGAPVVTIPSNMITLADGDTIKAELGGGLNATPKSNPNPSNPDRDSDLDNGVIAHEYGHGISIRLTGGPTNVGCLSGSEQAGEGWSDFWTVLLSAKPTDTPTDLRGVGSYVSFDDFLPGSIGIRNFPYTTSLADNPQTYATIATTNVPHGVGEVWMDMVYEVYWELVLKHGFDPDVYFGSGGNNLLIQLVIDGMKLQPCFPDFVEARDAILMADLVNNGGANRCEIWRGFAKRGLGVSAVAGPPADPPERADETEAFDIPADCPAGFGAIFFGSFEPGDCSQWDDVPFSPSASCN